MNILLISNLYPEPSEYGISPDTRAVHYFALEWIKKGYNVLVLHPYFNSVRKINRLFQYSHKIKEYLVDGIRVIFGESQILLPFKNASSEYQQKNLARRFKVYIEEHYPDFIPDRVVVHFPVISPVFNGYFLSKGNSFGTIHGVDISTLSNLSKYKRGIIVASLNKVYKQIYYRSMVLSEKGATYGIKTNGYNLVLSGIDDKLIAPLSTINLKLSAPRKKLNLIFAGKLNKQKRIDSILFALSRIKDAFDYSFTLVGDGPELEKLKRVSERLGVSNRTIFVGRKNRTEVSSYMSKSDVFLMLSKVETFGLVYLEAMGQGCLTIGSKGEGIDGVIINGKNGFLCTPGNIDEICKVLIKVSSLTSEQFNAIAFSGYNTALQMTSKIMADKYLELIEVKEELPINNR